ncbi:MAG: bifunctional hydroxymethylpyrimidine kinase/phosphomethylpyrimidine kinase [Myxococcaceae bacterium]
MSRAASAPAVLLAAGLEPTGQVGLLADLAAVAAAGGRPLGLATALTAQGSRFRCAPVPLGLLAAQLDAVLGASRPRSAKVGAVPDASTLAVLWPRLLRLHIPLVVDPVVRTSRGERLSALRREDFLALAGPSVWLTPNVPELAWLLGRRRVPATPAEVRALASRLLAEGFGAVVVKGGHLGGPPVDVLALPGRVHSWVGRRLRRGAKKRGTGCRFASTLATELAWGLPPAPAVAGARRAVRQYLRRPGPFP